MRKRNWDEEACDKEIRLFYTLVFAVGGVIGLSVLVWLLVSVWTAISNQAPPQNLWVDLRLSVARPCVLKKGMAGQLNVVTPVQKAKPESHQESDIPKQNGIHLPRQCLKKRTPATVVRPRVSDRFSRHQSPLRYRPYIPSRANGKARSDDPRGRRPESVWLRVGSGRRIASAVLTALTWPLPEGEEFDSPHLTSPRGRGV
ncbi:MAG TPA: hypothetical protein VJ783_29260 [Pirellulales bacterium]|nr:hypothetical protein [Pirellulales bacterium]